MTNHPEVPERSMPVALAAMLDGPDWEEGAFGEHYYHEDWASVEVYPCMGGSWDYLVRTYPEDNVSTRSITTIATLLAALDRALGPEVGDD